MTHFVIDLINPPELAGNDMEHYSNEIIDLTD